MGHVKTPSLWYKAVALVPVVGCLVTFQGPCFTRVNPALGRSNAVKSVDELNDKDKSSLTMKTEVSDAGIPQLISPRLAVLDKTGYDLIRRLMKTL